MNYLQRFENYDGLSITAAINKSILDRRLYREVSKGEFYNKDTFYGKYEDFTTTEKNHIIKYLTDLGGDIQNTSVHEIDFNMTPVRGNTTNIRRIPYESTIQKRYDGYFAVALNPLDNIKETFRFFICDQFDGLKDCLIYNLITK